MGRDPLLKGTVVRALKSCGHAQCRCQRGKKHGPFLYLSASVEGRTRTWHVPKGQEAYAREGTSRYKEFRTARERLVKIQKELVQLMNETLRLSLRCRSCTRRHSYHHHQIGYHGGDLHSGYFDHGLSATGSSVKENRASPTRLLPHSLFVS